MEWDYLVFAVNMLLVGAFLGLSYAFHKTLVSPLVVYAVFFIFPSNLNLITSFDEARLTYSGWWPIWVGSIFFGFGYLTYLTGVLGSNNVVTYAKRARLNRFEGVVNGKNYFQIVAFLFVVSSVACFINMARVVSTYGLDIFSIGRTYEIVFGAYTPLNYLYFLNLLVIPLATIGIHFHHKAAKLLKVMLFVSLFETLLIGHKSTFMYGLFIFIYCNLLILLRIKKIYFFLAAILILGVFLLVGVLRETATGFGDTDVISYLRSGIESYVVYNYKNLENVVRLQVVESTEVPLLGYIERVMGFFSGHIETVVVESTGESGAYYLANPAYNVTTYIPYLYTKYGGYVGIVGGSYLIGVVAAMLYFRLYSRPTLFIFLVNVIYLCMLTVSFSAFEFFRAQFLYLIFVSFLIGLSIRTAPTKALVQEGS